MSVFFFIAAFFFLLYSVTIISYTIGWFSLKNFKAKTILEYPAVSIVIACRNEEKNIAALLDSLAKQTYPKEKTEIIIVNDHSNDKTETVIQNHLHNSIQLLHLPDNVTGKKAALHYGIELAKSDIIITTDADCTMNENWILNLMSYYLKYKPKLLVAPVVFNSKQGLFQKFQALEFLSLVGSGAGAIGINRPIMCNGANLLFEKSLYENTVYNNNYASGDDIFLLLHTKKESRKEIHFIKSTEAVVYTEPAKNIKDFFVQRIRWASKSKSYKDFDIIFTALIVAIINSFLAMSLLLSTFNSSVFLCWIAFFIIKTITDIFLLFSATRFFKQTKLMYLYIPLQIIYPLYIVLAAIIGLFGRFRWKDRSFG